MANLPYKSKELFWLGSSLEKLTRFPERTKKQLGAALRQVQNGLTPQIARPLNSYGSGVHELKASTRGDTYRLVYLIKLKKGIYVLDAFMKKSKTGRRIPKEISTRLKQRIKEARAHDKE